MDNTKIKNKAVETAPKKKVVKKAPKDKTIEVVKEYCGIEKGTKYPLKSFDEPTIKMMVEKGLWVCK